MEDDSTAPGGHWSVDDVKQDLAAHDNSDLIVTDTFEPYYFERCVDRREQTITVDSRGVYQVFKRQVCPLFHRVNIDNMSDDNISDDLCTNNLTYKTVLKSSPESHNIDFSTCQALPISPASVGISEPIIVTAVGEQRYIGKTYRSGRIFTDTGQSTLNQDECRIPVMTHYYRDMGICAMQKSEASDQTEIIPLDYHVTASFPVVTQTILCADTDHISDVDEVSKSFPSGSDTDILSRVERSFSIDDDIRKNQVSMRLLERRKTIEVDKDDLSGLEVRHTSNLHFSIGSQEPQRHHSLKSEVNIVWGKTIDTDETRSEKQLFRSELCLNSFSDRSFDDSTDYFSADMSSDTIVTSDCADSFVDSLYTSDYNDSFLEQAGVYSDNTETISALNLLKYEEHEFTNITDYTDTPSVHSDMFIDLTKTYEIESPGKIGSSGNTDETLMAHPLDRKLLYKVSETIASLGRGVSEMDGKMTTHKFEPLFNQDCVPGEYQANISYLPDQNTNFQIIDGQNSNRPPSRVENDNCESLNEKMQRSEQGHSFGIVGESQVELKDIQHDCSTKVRLYVSKLYVSKLPNSSIVPTRVTTDESLDNTGDDVKTACASVGKQRRLSQEDLLLIQPHENTMLTVSSMKQSSSFNLEGRDTVLPPYYSTDASAHYFLDEKTNRPLSIYDPVDASSDALSSIDSIKYVTADNIITDYKNTANLNLLISNVSENQENMTTNTDNNMELMTNVESPPRIDRTVGEISNIIHLKIAEKPSEDVSASDVEYTNYTSQPLSSIGGTNIMATNCILMAKTVDNQTVEKCVERTEIFLRNSGSITCQRKVQISNVVSTTAPYTIATDSQQINEPKSDTYLPLSKSKSRERNEADSFDDNDEGFILVTSRRKKKLGKKKKRVQPTNVADTATDSCDDTQSKDSHKSSMGYHDFLSCQIVEAPLSNVMLVHLNHDKKENDALCPNSLQNSHDEDEIDTLSSVSMYSSSEPDNESGSIEPGKCEQPLLEKTLSAQATQCLDSNKDHFTYLTMTGIAIETGAFTEHPTTDLNITERLFESGAITEPTTTDLNATESMSESGAITEPPTTDLNLTKRLFESGAITKLSITDRTVTEKMFQSVAIIEPPTVDITVTDILYESGAITEPFVFSSEISSSYERDTNDEGVHVEVPSKTAAEECRSEEFICRMLEGTNAHGYEYGEEFLHSDEYGGMLLNIYTGGHRRILKPYRRFTKPDRQAPSLAGDKDSDFTDPFTNFEDNQKKVEESTVTPSDLNSITDETLLDRSIKKESRPRDKGHKRKREGIGNAETPIVNDAFSELNASDDSGSMDASLEDIEQAGEDFGAYMSDEYTDVSEKCVPLFDQQDTLPDGVKERNHRFDSPCEKQSNVLIHILGQESFVDRSEAFTNACSAATVTLTKKLDAATQQIANCHREVETTANKPVLSLRYFERLDDLGCQTRNLYFTSENFPKEAGVPSIAVNEGINSTTTQSGVLIESEQRPQLFHELVSVKTAFDSDDNNTEDDLLDLCGISARIDTLLNENEEGAQDYVDSNIEENTDKGDRIDYRTEDMSVAIYEQVENVQLTLADSESVKEENDNVNLNISDDYLQPTPATGDPVSRCEETVDTVTRDKCASLDHENRTVEYMENVQVKFRGEEEEEEVCLPDSIQKYGDNNAVSKHENIAENVGLRITDEKLESCEKHERNLPYTMTRDVIRQQIKDTHVADEEKVIQASDIKRTVEAVDSKEWEYNHHPEHVYLPDFVTENQNNVIDESENIKANGERIAEDADRVKCESYDEKEGRKDDITERIIISTAESIGISDSSSSSINAPEIHDAKEVCRMDNSVIDRVNCKPEDIATVKWTGDDEDNEVNNDILDRIKVSSCIVGNVSMGDSTVDNIERNVEDINDAKWEDGEEKQNRIEEMTGGTIDRNYINALDRHEYFIEDVAGGTIDSSDVIDVDKHKYFSEHHVELEIKDIGDIRSKYREHKDESQGCELGQSNQKCRDATEVCTNDSLSDSLKWKFDDVANVKWESDDDEPRYIISNSNIQKCVSVDGRTDENVTDTVEWKVEDIGDDLGASPNEDMVDRNKVLRADDKLSGSLEWRIEDIADVKWESEDEDTSPMEYMADRNKELRAADTVAGSRKWRVEDIGNVKLDSAKEEDIKINFIRDMRTDNEPCRVENIADRKLHIGDNNEDNINDLEYRIRELSQENAVVKVEGIPSVDVQRTVEIIVDVTWETDCKDKDPEANSLDDTKENIIMIPTAIVEDNAGNNQDLGVEDTDSVNRHQDNEDDKLRNDQEDAIISDRGTSVVYRNDTFEADNVHLKTENVDYVKLESDVDNDPINNTFNRIQAHEDGIQNIESEWRFEDIDNVKWESDEDESNDTILDRKVQESIGIAADIRTDENVTDNVERRVEDILDLKLKSADEDDSLMEDMPDKNKVLRADDKLSRSSEWRVEDIGDVKWESEDEDASPREDMVDRNKTLRAANKVTGSMEWRVEDIDNVKWDSDEEEDIKIHSIEDMRTGNEPCRVENIADKKLQINDNNNDNINDLEYRIREVNEDNAFIKVEGIPSDDVQRKVENIVEVAWERDCKDNDPEANSLDDTKENRIMIPTAIVEDNAGNNQDLGVVDTDSENRHQDNEDDKLRNDQEDAIISDKGAREVYRNDTFETDNIHLKTESVDYVKLESDVDNDPINNTFNRIQAHEGGIQNIESEWRFEDIDNVKWESDEDESNDTILDRKVQESIGIAADIRTDENVTDNVERRVEDILDLKWKSADEDDSLMEDMPDKNKVLRADDKLSRSSEWRVEDIGDVKWESEDEDASPREDMVDRNKTLRAANKVTGGMEWRVEDIDNVKWDRDEEEDIKIHSIEDMRTGNEPCRVENIADKKLQISDNNNDNINDLEYRIREVSEDNAFIKVEGIPSDDVQRKVENIVEVAWERDCKDNDPEANSLDDTKENRIMIPTAIVEDNAGNNQDLGVVDTDSENRHQDNEDDKLRNDQEDAIISDRGAREVYRNDKFETDNIQLKIEGVDYVKLESDVEKKPSNHIFNRIQEQEGEIQNIVSQWRFEDIDDVKWESDDEEGDIKYDILDGSKGSSCIVGDVPVGFSAVDNVEQSVEEIKVGKLECVEETNRIEDVTGGTIDRSNINAVDRHEYFIEDVARGNIYSSDIISVYRHKYFIENHVEWGIKDIGDVRLKHLENKDERQVFDVEQSNQECKDGTEVFTNDSLSDSVQWKFEDIDNVKWESDDDEASDTILDRKIQKSISLAVDGRTDEKIPDNVERRVEDIRDVKWEIAGEDDSLMEDMTDKNKVLRADDELSDSLEWRVEDIGDVKWESDDEKEEPIEVDGNEDIINIRLSYGTDDSIRDNVQLRVGVIDHIQRSPDESKKKGVVNSFDDIHADSIASEVENNNKDNSDVEDEVQREYPTDEIQGSSNIFCAKKSPVTENMNWRVGDNCMTLEHDDGDAERIDYLAGIIQVTSDNNLVFTTGEVQTENSQWIIDDINDKKCERDEERFERRDDHADRTQQVREMGAFGSTEHFTGDTAMWTFEDIGDIKWESDDNSEDSKDNLTGRSPQSSADKMEYCVADIVASKVINSVQHEYKVDTKDIADDPEDQIHKNNSEAATYIKKIIIVADSEKFLASSGGNGELNGEDTVASILSSPSRHSTQEDFSTSGLAANHNYDNMNEQIRALVKQSDENSYSTQHPEDVDAAVALTDSSFHDHSNSREEFVGFDRSTNHKYFSNIDSESQTSEMSQSVDNTVNKTTREHSATAGASVRVNISALLADLTLKTGLTESQKNRKKKKKKKHAKKHEKKNVQVYALEQGVNVNESFVEHSAVIEGKGVAAVADKMSVFSSRSDSARGESLNGLNDILVMGIVSQAVKYSTSSVAGPQDSLRFNESCFDCEYKHTMETLSQTIDVENNKTESTDGKDEMSQNETYAICELASSDTTKCLENETINKAPIDLSGSLFNMSFRSGRLPKLDDELKINNDVHIYSGQESDQAEQRIHVDKSSFSDKTLCEGDESIGGGCLEDNALTLDSGTQYQTDYVPHLFIDRSETLLPPTPTATISKNLLEDVIRTKTHAEQLVAQNPEASQKKVIHDLNSTSAEPTLTPAGHLMSEIGLLETSAKDQWDSLRVAAQQHQIYLRDLHILSRAIDEAKKKLQASPVTTGSVGELRQLMTERTNLTEQIKSYNIQISEVNEKIRQLALDSAQLSPSVFRKHYHPESAYADYFAATSQNKKGAIPFHSSGQLFYDSLPEFNLSSSYDEDFQLFLSPDELENWKHSEHQKPGHVMTHISLELPRLIPPPRTDSIPRPTWSGEILSTASSSSNMSRGTSVSHSLGSPRTMAKAFEASASSAKSVGSVLVSTEQITESCNSTTAAETGPEIYQSNDASNTNTHYSNIGESSSGYIHYDTDSHPTIDSAAKRLTVVAESEQKEAPVERQPTETTLMQGFMIENNKMSPNNWNVSSECHPESNECQSAGMLATSATTVAQHDIDTQEQGNWSSPEAAAGVTSNVQTVGTENAQITSGEMRHKRDAKEEGNQKHEIGVETYRKHIDDVKNWLKENTGQQSSMTLSLDEHADIQTQLLENKNIQEQINKQLEKLSALILQCDSLSEEDPIAGQLYDDLLSLQRDLNQAKQAAFEKQLFLEAAVGEDVDSGTGRANKLGQDIKNHVMLINEIVQQGRHSASSHASNITNDAEVKENWERLSRDLTQKTENLECTLRTQELEDLVKISIHAPAKHSDSNKQLENVTRLVADLNSAWNLQQTQLHKNQLSPNEALELQQKHQSVLQNISNWLDLAEQQMFTVPLSTEEQVIHNENLKRQIQCLQDNVNQINKQAKDQVESTDTANKELIEKCHSDLTERLKMIDTTTTLQAKDLQSTEKQWKQYQGEVTNLQRQLQDIQNEILLPAATQSLDQLLSKNQQTEVQLKMCENKLQELKATESSLTQKYPKGVFMSELVPLQSKYMELHRKAVERKTSTQNLVTLRDQYKKMLKDCGDFLETAENKLQVDSMSAKDLSHLKQQLAANKEFFSDIEVHKATLDSLANKCDPSTRSQYQQQHASLSARIHVLVDQASLHDQRLERLTRQWADLEEKYTMLQKVLFSLEAQMPEPVDSEDSLAAIHDKCNKYKWLQGELTANRDSVFEVLDRGNQILHSINCPNLENAITELKEKWVSLNTKLTQELKRTESLGDLLSVFETELAVLSSWLITAKMKLEGFKNLSHANLQNISAVRSEVEKILEFRKDVADQVHFKNKVMSIGNQLLQNKTYDTMGLSGRLKDCEEEWKQLEKGIADTQEYLLQVQMKLMPSRQALKELTDWVYEIRKSLEKDAHFDTKTEADIKRMLKKYKNYQTELTGRQMSVDFVNQTVLVPKAAEVNVSREKLEFAESLTELNKQWQQATTEINDRLNELEDVNSKWEEYGKAVENLQSWFHQQEGKIQNYQCIGNVVGVKQSLEDCRALQQQLQYKQTELAATSALGNYLIQLSHDSPDSQLSIRDSLSILDHNMKRLEERTVQQQCVLVDIVSQWTQYHNHLALLNEVVAQADYALDNYKLIRGDITTLQSQVNKLKVVHTHLENNSDQLKSFSAIAGQLRQVCEPSVQADLQKTVSDIQIKWKQLSTDLMQRCNEYEQYLDEWQLFENQYSRIQDWLDDKGALFTHLSSTNTNAISTETLTKCTELQQELDSFQTHVSDLHRQNEMLTKNMNPSTVSIMKSRQFAIDQRMLALKEKLSQLSVTVSNDLSMHEKFNEIFEVVKKFLSYAETILNYDDPTKAAEQQAIKLRCEQLRNLLLLFSCNHEHLDEVNDLGYQLALNKIDATRLRQLNHKWYKLYEDTKDKSKILQGNLLQQQNFTSKCEAWKTFMTQTEQQLAEEVKRNLGDLSDQLRNIEQFENELYSQQQIIYAILSDGQKMISVGEVEDNDEFQRKLNLLFEQWQHVSRKVSQRKITIVEIINKWKEFNTLSQQLRYWLKDTEKNLVASPSDSNSLQAIKNSMEKVQHELQVQESTYNKICDLGGYLLQHADDKAAKEIKATLSKIQDSRHKVLTVIEERNLQLEDIDHQWLYCETEVEDMLCQLTEIRRILNADLPKTYDELELEINRCKDIEKAFIESENKEQSLLAKKEQLVKIIQKEDMNLLQQRIQLLTKQREELQHQTQAREDKIIDTLYRLTDFNKRLKSLVGWIEEMTIKLSNPDISIEDLLAKLENEYKQEAENKEVQKALILEQGRQLMKVSNDIKASEIDQQLLQLEDKWQHLKGVMDNRYRKLRDTALGLKQLDASMSNLSQWLSAVENVLNEDIIFNSNDLRELEAKLQDSKELQYDIDRHAESVRVLLNLCKMLLNDPDACPTETEFLALEHSMKNLEKRWKTICMVSPQRKTRVEETWQLWGKFQDDCDKFSKWITQMEHEIGDSETEVLNVKIAKEYITKYEGLQSNIHDHLSDLEHINRIYCQLVKSCTGSDRAQKDINTKLNERWDALQHKVTEIMKKLCSSSIIREDFEASRTALLNWLTDFNEQLTELQSSPALNLEARVRVVQRLNDEIKNKRNRISYLDQAGMHLMQKADSHEALRVQRELDTFRSLYKTMQDRFVSIKLQMEQMSLTEVEDKSTKYSSEDRQQQLDADHSRELHNVPQRYARQQHIADLEKFLKESPPESPAIRQKLTAYNSRESVSPSRATFFTTSEFESQRQRSQSPSLLRSRSPTLKSMTVTRSVSPLRRLSPSQRSPTRLAIDITGQTKIRVLMEQLAETLDDCNIKLLTLEQTLQHSGGTEQSMRTLAECETSVDHVKTLDRLLKTETGLHTIDSVDAQVKSVVHQWKYLQSYIKDFRLSKEQYGLVQFENDIERMLTWLDEAEALKSRSQFNFQEFLSQMESKEADLLFINQQSVNQKHLRTELSRKRQLKAELDDLNRRWKLIRSWAANMQRDKQSSWIEHEEFLTKIDDYHLWLEKTETQVRHCEPVNISVNQSVLWEKYAKLQELHHEVINNQATILTLKETADQLLKNTELPEFSTARDKIYIVHKRVQTLTNLISSYITALENGLKTSPKRETHRDSFDTSEAKSSGIGSSYASRSSTPLQPGSLTLRTGNQSPFAVSRLRLPFLSSRTTDRENLSTEPNLETVDVQDSKTTVAPALITRVLRAALPIYLLLLLLWLLFWLIPVCEDENSCMRINNLQHSMMPLLRYTDGAPPI